MVKTSDIPDAGEGKRGEAGYLGYLLRQAAGAHRLRMDRAFADLDVTVPQFLVLVMVKAYEGASGADVARLTQLTPQTVSVIIANLEKSGLVMRASHPDHGRIQIISPTEKGLHLLADCKARAAMIDADLTEGFSAGDMAVVRRWLVWVGQGEM